MRSSEPEQLARHCNRVVALRDGRVTQEFVGADLNTDKISLATLSRAVSVRDLTLARTDAEASTPFCLPECPRISREREFHIQKWLAPNDEICVSKPYSIADLKR